MKLFLKGVSFTLAVLTVFFACQAVLTAEHLHAQVAGTTGITSSFGFEPDYSSDYGPVLGGGVTLEQSGVGNDPYRCAMKFRGGAAPFVEFRYRLQYRGDFRVLLQNTSLLVEASTSGLEVMDFFGFGNESYYSGSGYSEDYFELKSQITKIGATLCYPMQSDYYWSAGIRAKWVDLDITPGSYADQHRAEIPGIDNSFSGSLRIGFCYDTRQTSLSPGLSPDLKKTRFSHETAGSNTAVSGMVLNVEAALYPEFFGNERAFTKLSAEIRSYIPVSRDGNSRAVLRIGTEKLWGNFPFWEAAYLGGSTSLRGYERQRFAGDASLYAGSEFRIHAGEFRLYLPVIWGPLAFVESGRVFLEGEDSSAWHTGAGGGLWFGTADSRYTASLTYGRGFDEGRLTEDVGIYARAGFSF